MLRCLWQSFECVKRAARVFNNSELPASPLYKSIFNREPPDFNQMSSHSSPTKNYTLAGSPEWKKNHRSKPITQFSLREREFIKDSLTSEWDENFTGTRVIYVEPEG